jgi:DNA gyrase subunit A
MGRATQGVRLINLREGDEISSVARIENGEEDEIALNEANALLELQAENALNETELAEPSEPSESEESQEDNVGELETEE